VFLLIPCCDWASILISSFIWAPSWFSGMKTPLMRSDSLSHGTVALSVMLFINSFLLGGNVVGGVVGGSVVAMFFGVSVSAFSFWAISFRTSWVSSVSSSGDIVSAYLVALSSAI